MDDVPTRVIESAERCEKSAPPEGIGSDAVGKGEPERHIDDPGQKVHATEESASAENESDGCEDELKVDHGAHGEGGGNATGGKKCLGEFIFH